MDIKLHGAEEEPKPDLNKLYLVCWRHGPNIEWCICNYVPGDSRSGLFLDNRDYLDPIERDECIGWLELPDVDED